MHTILYTGGLSAFIPAWSSSHSVVKGRGVHCHLYSCQHSPLLFCVRTRGDGVLLACSGKQVHPRCGPSMQIPKWLASLMTTPRQLAKSQLCNVPQCNGVLLLGKHGQPIYAPLHVASRVWALLMLPAHPPSAQLPSGRHVAAFGRQGHPLYKLCGGCG